MTAAATPAPVPVLTLDGTHAVITGVRFTWQIHCAFCRAAARAVGDGGAIRLGLNVSRSGKTCRWYYTDRPGPLPELPARCDHCGRADAFYPDMLRTARHILPQIPHTLDLTNRVYATIRAGWPAEVAKADAYTRRQLTR